MSAKTVDVRATLRMALQHILIVGPDATVQKAIEDADDAIAELIEADRAYESARFELNCETITHEEKHRISWPRFYAAAKRRAEALGRMGVI